jgi:hypothetical protein
VVDDELYDVLSVGHESGSVGEEDPAEQLGHS